MGAEYLFYVKSIATFTPTFYGFIISALQMFTGLYGGFTGILMCGDFKFTGFACYLHSLQSFLQGIRWHRDATGIPYISHREIMYKMWENQMTEFIGELNLICMKNIQYA